MSTPWIPGYQPPKSPKAGHQVKAMSGQPFEVTLLELSPDAAKPKVVTYILQKYGLEEKVLLKDETGNYLFTREHNDGRRDLYFRQDGTTIWTPGTYQLQVYVDDRHYCDYWITFENHPDVSWGAKELDGSF